MTVYTTLATQRRCNGSSGRTPFSSRLVVSIAFLLFLSLLPSSSFIKAATYSQWPTDFGGPNRNGMPNEEPLDFYCSDLSNLTLTQAVNLDSEISQTDYTLRTLSYTTGYVHSYTNATLLSFDVGSIGIAKRGPYNLPPFESDHPVIFASAATNAIVSEQATTAFLLFNSGPPFREPSESISSTCSPVYFFDEPNGVEYFALALGASITASYNFEIIRDFSSSTPTRQTLQCGDANSPVVSFLPDVAGYDLLGLTNTGELCSLLIGSPIDVLFDFGASPDPNFEAVWHEGTSSIIIVDSTVGFKRLVLPGLVDLNPTGIYSPAPGSKLAVSELWSRLYYFTDATTLSTLELEASATNPGVSVTLPEAFLAGPSVGEAVFVVTTGHRLLAYDLRYLTPLSDINMSGYGIPLSYPIFNPSGSLVFIAFDPPRIVGFGIANCALADTSDSSSTTPSVTASVSISASRSGTPSVSTTPSASMTRSASVTPSNTASNTASISLTPSVTCTQSNTPSMTRTQSNTPSVTRTHSNTPSVTRTYSNTPSKTASRSHSGSNMPTPTPTPDPSSSRIIVFPPTQPPSLSKSKKKDNDKTRRPTKRPTKRPTPTSSVIVVGPKECDSIEEVRCPNGKCEKDPRDCTGKVDLGDKIVENKFKFNNETRRKTVKIMVTTKDQVVATVEVPPNTIPSGWTLRIGPSTNDEKLSACDREDDSDESATLHSKSYDLTVEDEKGRRRRLEDLPKDIKLSSFARLKKGTKAGELCYGFARNEDRQWSCLSKLNATFTNDKETVYISSATDHLTSFGVLLAYSGESCHNSAYWIAAIVLLGSACACIVLVILAYEFIAPFKAYVGGYRAKQSLRRIERRASEKILLERRISAKNVTLQGNLSLHRPTSIPANVIEAIS